eukprot:7956985-Heterocapsa_arctica.AAC.1
MRVLGIEAGELVRVAALCPGRARGVMRFLSVRARLRWRRLRASSIAGCGTCFEEDLTGGARTAIVRVGLRVEAPPPSLDL